MDWDAIVPLPTASATPSSPGLGGGSGTKRAGVDEHSVATATDAAPSPVAVLSASPAASPNGSVKQQRRLMLRSSSTSPGTVASDESVEERLQHAMARLTASAPLLPSATVSTIDAVTQLERDLADPIMRPHRTTLELFHDDPALHALPSTDVVPMAEVFGMGDVFSMLREHVGRPMAASDVIKCEGKVMFMHGAPGVGIRTAVRSYCAQAGEGPAMAPFRCNLITYRFLNGAVELARDARFFKVLVAMAMRHKPCVMLMHRITARCAREAAELFYDLLFTAFVIPYLEESEAAFMTPPDIWLVFADEVPPAQVAPKWGFITKVCAVLPMNLEQKRDFMRVRLRRRLGAFLGSADDIDQLMRDYEPLVLECIVADHSACFNRATALVEFVDGIFSRATRRITFEEARLLSTSTTLDDDKLPQRADFHDALQAQVAKYEARLDQMQRSANDFARRQRALVSGMSSPHGNPDDPHYNNPAFPPPSRR